MPTAALAALPAALSARTAAPLRLALASTRAAATCASTTRAAAPLHLALASSTRAATPPRRVLEPVIRNGVERGRWPDAICDPKLSLLPGRDWLDDRLRARWQR